MSLSLSLSFWGIKKVLARCFQKGRDQDGPQKKEGRLMSGTHLPMLTKVLRILVAYIGASLLQMYCITLPPEAGRTHVFEKWISQGQVVP